MSEPTNIEILRICAATLKIELPADDVLEKESSAYGFLPGWDVLRALYNAGRAAALAEGVDGYVVWYWADDSEQSGVCGPDIGEHLVFDKPEFARDFLKRMARRSRRVEFAASYEVRPARLLVATGEGEG